MRRVGSISSRGNSWKNALGEFQNSVPHTTTDKATPSGIDNSPLGCMMAGVITAVPTLSSFGSICMFGLPCPKEDTEVP